MPAHHPRLGTAPRPTGGSPWPEVCVSAGSNKFGEPLGLQPLLVKGIRIDVCGSSRDVCF